MFDFLLIWLESVHPFLSLTWLCFLISLAGVYVYGKLSCQEELKKNHYQLKLIHMEMRLCSHDVLELISLQKKALTLNLCYLRKALFPSLVIIFFVLIAFVPIKSCYEFSPIRKGSIFSVDVKMNENIIFGKNPILREIPDGLKIIEVDQKSEFLKSWYFRAVKNGEYFLTFTLDDGSAKKRVLVESGIQMVNPVLSKSGWGSSTNDGDKEYLSGDNQVDEISVEYEENIFPYKVFGFELGWIGYSTVVFIALIFILKPLARLY